MLDTILAEQNIHTHTLKNNCSSDACIWTKRLHQTTTNTEVKMIKKNL